MFVKVSPISITLTLTVVTNNLLPRYRVQSLQKVTKICAGIFRPMTKTLYLAVLVYSISP